MTDLPWFPGDERPSVAQPRKCRHPKSVRAVHEGTWRCTSCNHIASADRIRGGRRNRNRGNAIERWVCGLLGIARRGQYGGPDDGGGEADWITVQVKSGVGYPERIDHLLRSLPTRSGQLRGVVHADAPGAGNKRRALITLDLYDFAEWYGGKEGAA